MNTPLATEILRASAVVVGATAADKAEAIERVGGLLVAEGLVTDEYVRAMHEREAIISTYLGNGIALHCAEAGQGPLVVLLHGFPEHWGSWRYQIPALAAAGFRVLTE